MFPPKVFHQVFSPVINATSFPVANCIFMLWNKATTPTYRGGCLFLNFSETCKLRDLDSRTLYCINRTTPFPIPGEKYSGYLYVTCNSHLALTSMHSCSTTPPKSIYTIHQVKNQSFHIPQIHFRRLSQAKQSKAKVRITIITPNKSVGMSKSTSVIRYQRHSPETENSKCAILSRRIPFIPFIPKVEIRIKSRFKTSNLSPTEGTPPQRPLSVSKQYGKKLQDKKTATKRTGDCENVWMYMRKAYGDPVPSTIITASWCAIGCDAFIPDYCGYGEVNGGENENENKNNANQCQIQVDIQRLHHVSMSSRCLNSTYAFNPCALGSDITWMIS
ncbi:hypothetical protein BDV97DRAFT_109243 [Delphinella strobiligena]|nr:hypothetical protein BDV97DRAFT_109243 [Delphinella strobiligena]